MKLGCVLLASGFATRFGSNKLLATVQGVPLIARALEACPAALFSQAVVTSQYDEILSLAALAGYQPLPNLKPEEGIAAGIRLGLAHLPGVEGALFSVCDQPWLTRESVTRLIAAFTHHPQCIVALACGGWRGNPVIFPKDLFPPLAALTGDVGGGAVIRAHAHRLLLVEASSAAELQDVDTLADLGGPGGHGPWGHGPWGR